MNTALLWDNVVAYSLQVGLLVGVASMVPALLRLHPPKARLVYLQVLLAACLVLPQTRPWKRAVVAVTTPVAAPAAPVAGVAPAPAPSVPARPHWSPGELGLVVLAAGVLARLGWLAVGFAKLRRYRRRSTPWSGPAVTLGPRPEYRLSEDVGSPVTFGLRSPVVLLPRNFDELPPAMQEAVLCHEALHVERHDWAFTVAEELVRALFWFHPAIWWLLGEIQLAREQAVDREVVDRTQARDHYVDALLAVAGARMEFDLAPAPLFLRKRHLKQRVMAVVKEIRMSRTRSIATLLLGLGLMAVAGWFVTAAFPLAAEPQLVVDGPGISVELSGAQLLHRPAVRYPAEALAEGVQGTVAVQVRLGADGTVVDANIVSGPDELRKAVLESVLSWHFSKDSAGGGRTVTVSFQLPAQAAAPAGPAHLSPEFQAEVAARSAAALANTLAQKGIQAPGLEPSKIVSIEVSGLSEQARADLLAALPVHVGDAFSPDAMNRTYLAVRAFDSHLLLTGRTDKNHETTLSISTPDATVAAALGSTPGSGPQTRGTPRRVQIGGNVQAAMLIDGPKPAYPPIAMQARITGVVHLHVIISTEGNVQSITVIPPAHPLLTTPAMEAVRQWRYKPTKLNGEPVEVDTTVDVTFALADGPPPQPVSTDSPLGQAGQPGLSTLGLRVEHAGSDLVLRWNLDSSAVRNGQNGVLQVLDGYTRQNYPISRDQLTSGLGVVYTPQTKDLTFQLTVTDEKGNEVGKGGVRLLNPSPGSR